MIAVTKSTLPELDDYVERLKAIWSRGQLTNHGPVVTQLEQDLCAALGAKHVVSVCNGTVALQLAIRALNLSGDVITTPFSYVATTSSLVWEGCRPVFADIDNRSLCISPRQVEAELTERTSGILATHVYGNACDVKALSSIARERGLRLLFDAAHGFGAKYGGQSLASWGDAAVLSFHATKLFHTAEGGAVVTNDDDVACRLRYLRNFGHEGPEAFQGLGINGKLSELHAAMGLCVLPLVEREIARRCSLSAVYDDAFTSGSIVTPSWASGLERNYAYYPILLSSESQLLEARDRLSAHEIFPRRYFFPSLNRLPYVGTSAMPVAESAAARVLCLPMGSDVTRSTAISIAEIVASTCTEP